jgi:hypothetical protein
VKYRHRAALGVLVGGDRLLKLCVEADAEGLRLSPRELGHLVFY